MNSHTLFKQNNFCGLGMKSILKSFSEHGTFIHPEAMDYISSKDKPSEFASFLLKNLKEYPLVLTLDQIRSIEQTTSIEEPAQHQDQGFQACS